MNTHCISLLLTSKAAIHCIIDIISDFNLITVVFDNIPQCARANPCYESDKCENRVPGYQCAACPDGFRGNAPSGVGLEDAENSKQVCEEIDECKEGISSCDPNSQCINTNVSQYAPVIVLLCVMIHEDSLVSYSQCCHRPQAPTLPP